MCILFVTSQFNGKLHGRNGDTILHATATIICRHRGRLRGGGRQNFVLDPIFLHHSTQNSILRRFSQEFGV